MSKKKLSSFEPNQYIDPLLLSDTMNRCSTLCRAGSYYPLNHFFYTVWMVLVVTLGWDAHLPNYINIFSSTRNLEPKIILSSFLRNVTNMIRQWHITRGVKIYMYFCVSIFFFKIMPYRIFLKICEHFYQWVLAVRYRWPPRTYMVFALTIFSLPVLSYRRFAPLYII
jgi:hypothetical protein